MSVSVPVSSTLHIAEGALVASGLSGSSSPVSPGVGRVSVAPLLQELQPDWVLFSDVTLSQLVQGSGRFGSPSLTRLLHLWVF